MDINKLLEGVHCACGKHHKCNIESVFIEKNAISKLEQLCAEYENILVVADENTFSAAGKRAEKVLNDKNIKKVIFDGKKLLIPNENAIDMVNSQMNGVDLILAVGSGVIQDLCKYVAYFADVPYIVVATAPSMDGYASNGAAMILNGMKETVSAGLPKAIVADTQVLMDAPADMIKAGYGDIIGKFSALCDWKLSNEVTGEYFCQYIYDTTYEMIESTIDIAEGLVVRDEKSVKTLMEALIVVGIMMSFAGSSRPASGSEHHLSHFFEIIGIVNSEPYLPHGTDVAYSTVVTTQLRERLLDFDFSQKKPGCHNKEEYAENIKRIYKTVADGCIKLQDKAGSYDIDRISTYIKKENEIKEILKDSPDSDEITAILSKVGLDMKEFYEIYDKEKIKDAVFYAKDLKDRYSVLWMYYDMFK